VGKQVPRKFEGQRRNFGGMHFWARGCFVSRVAGTRRPCGTTYGTRRSQAAGSASVAVSNLGTSGAPFQGPDLSSARSARGSRFRIATIEHAECERVKRLVFGSFRDPLQVIREGWARQVAGMAMGDSTVRPCRRPVLPGAARTQSRAFLCVGGPVRASPSVCRRAKAEAAAP